MSLSRVISSCSITVQHYSFTRSATPVTKWLISSLVLDRRDGAYVDNIENLKEYSSTLILPWLRLINSSTLTSILSRGKYFQRKSSLNLSHSIGLAFTGLLFPKLILELDPNLILVLPLLGFGISWGWNLQLLMDIRWMMIHKVS